MGRFSTAGIIEIERAPVGGVPELLQRWFGPAMLRRVGRDERARLDAGATTMA